MKGISLLSVLPLITRSSAFVPTSHLSSVNLKLTTSPRSPLSHSPELKPKKLLTLSADATADDSDSSNRNGLWNWLQQTKPASKNRLTLGLAFLTGWADVALLTKYSTFATMMTGNLLKLASAAIDSRYNDVGLYASMITCYVLGLVGFRCADRSLHDKSLSFVCAPVVAGLFCAADYLSYLNPARRWPSLMMLAVGFGVVNSVGTEVAGTLAFVVTGHITKITGMMADRVSRTAGRKKLTKADKATAFRCATVILGFFSGALWACGLFRRFPRILDRGVFSILGLLYGMLFLWQDHETLGAWWLGGKDKMCDIDTYETSCV